MEYIKFEPISSHPNYLIDHDGVIIEKDTKNRVERMDNNMVHLLDENGLTRRYPVDRLVLITFSQMNLFDTNSFDIIHLDKDNNNNSLNNLKWSRRKIRSRFIGLYWRTELGAWEANIRINKKKIFLGSFGNEVEAAIKVEKEKRKHYGQNARFNFKDLEMKIPRNNKKIKKYVYPNKIYSKDFTNIKFHVLKKFPNYKIFENGVILNQKNNKLVSGFMNNGVRIVYITNIKGYKKSFMINYLLHKCNFYDYPSLGKRKRVREEWGKTMVKRIR